MFKTICQVVKIHIMAAPRSSKKVNNVTFSCKSEAQVAVLVELVCLGLLDLEVIVALVLVVVVALAL